MIPIKFLSARRAFLLTVAVFYMTLSVIAVGTLLSDKEVLHDSPTATIPDINRVMFMWYDLHNATGKIVNESGVHIVVNDSLFSVTEMLPNGQVGSMSSSLSDYEGFLDEKMSELDITFGDFTARGYFEEPYTEMGYAHDVFGQSNVTLNWTNDGMVQNITFVVHTGANNLSSISWGDVGNGSIPVSIRAYDDEGAESSMQRDIDLADNNIIRVFHTGGTTTFTLLPGEIDLSNDGNAVTIEQNVTTTPVTEGRRYIHVPGITVSAESAISNAKKSSTLTLG